MTESADLRTDKVYRFDYPEDTPPVYVHRLESGSFEAIHDLRGGDYGPVNEISQEHVQGILDSGEVNSTVIDFEESPFEASE